ncbi:hypothetical protein FIBSPDRAFT_850031 [Athelia psychrophila]|uniref:Uncharacterized protein n=1 Tax=Athelia psychrophila TaxID=1759441 RepID=A0A166TVV0_9AGAM|nr:hypothetical protein FIBSPDRAFT_850031 [Fibularhizoctonia sp. CBS 109695]
MDPFSVLPPAIAGQYQASCYILAATLTAYVYDWLLSISEEQAIYARYGLPRSNAIYLFSRRVSYSLILPHLTSIPVPPMDGCQAVERSVGVLSVLTTAATSSLFLLRVRAVYSYSAVVTTLLGCLWVGMIGGTAYYIKSLSAQHIPTTDRCTESSTDNYLLILPTVVLGVTDTIIFVAISYRPACNSISADAGRCGWVQAFMKGDGLYSLSKALLKSGQVYFLATIGAFLVNLVVMTASGVPNSMRYILLPAYVGFTNIMACVVFRWVALAVYHEKDAALALAGLDKELKMFVTDTGSKNGESGRQMTLTSDSAIRESGGMRLGTVLEGTLLEESGGSGFV